MRLAWSDNEILYVYEIFSNYNCQITAVASTNDFYENNPEYKKMTYKEFKENYSKDSDRRSVRYKKVKQEIMTDINKEAEEYRKQNRNRWKEGYTSFDFIDAFIAGYNSKATQAKVLQGQIDVLKEIDNKCFGGSNTCKVKIEKLQQKLKQLENE
jgi:hypothetical protein